MAYCRGTHVPFTCRSLGLCAASLTACGAALHRRLWHWRVARFCAYTVRSPLEEPRFRRGKLRRPDLLLCSAGGLQLLADFTPITVQKTPPCVPAPAASWAAAACFADVALAAQEPGGTALSAGFHVAKSPRYAPRELAALLAARLERARHVWCGD